MKQIFKTIAIVNAMVLLPCLSYTQVTTPNNFGAVGDFVGWDANQNFDLNIRHDTAHNINFWTNHVQQMTILGTNNTLNGFVGVGTASPTSLFHIDGTQANTGNVFRTDGPGVNTWRMQRSGGLYGTLYNNNDRHFYMRSDSGDNIFRAFGSNSTVDAMGERMRITNGDFLDNVGAVITANVARTSISYLPTNTLTVPLTALHIGVPYTLTPTSQGYRTWMDLGVLISDNCLTYHGFKRETLGGNRLDAVMAWGDDHDDFFRVIFSQYTALPGTANTTNATSFDGEEVARFAPNGNVGIGNYYLNGLSRTPQTRLELLDNHPDSLNNDNSNLPQLRLTYTYDTIFANGVHADFQSDSLGDLLINTQRMNGASVVPHFVGINASLAAPPLNTLDINSTALSPKPSGLRLRNLTASSTIESNPSLKVLSVDSSGHVIIVHDSMSNGVGTCGGILSNYLTLYNGSAICSSLVYQKPAAPGINFIGIGTTTPTSALHIDGNSASLATGEVFKTDCGSANSTYWHMLRGGATYGSIFNETGNRFFNIRSDSSQLRLHTYGTITSTAPILRMMIDTGINATGGYVAIGNQFSTPKSRLHIHHGSAVEVKLQITNSVSSSGTNRGLRIGVDAIAAAEFIQHENHPMLFYTNGTERARIDSTGRVGIGTTLPKSFVHQHINSSSNNYLQFTNSTTTQTGDTVGFRAGIDFHGYAELRQEEDLPMIFYTAGPTGAAVERMRIQSGTNNGYVGINTIAPGCKLEVVGETPGVVATHTAVAVTENTSYNAAVATGITVDVSNASNTARGIKLQVTDTQATQGIYGHIVTTGLESNDAGYGSYWDVTGVSKYNYGIVTNAYNGLNNYGAIFNAQGVGATVNNSGVISKSDGGGSHCANSYGVIAQAYNATGNNYAVQADAQGAANSLSVGVLATAYVANCTDNYGVSAYADQASNINYAVYAETPVGTCDSIAANCVAAAGFFNGDIFVGGTAYLPSDNFLKDSIQNITNVQNILSQLQPKVYKFNPNIGATSTLHLPGGTHYGFLAPDVEAITPQFVKRFKAPALKDTLGNILKPELEFKGINYIEFITLLVAGHQDQEQKIDSIIDLTQSLATQLALLQAQINNCCPSLNNGQNNLQGQNQGSNQRIPVELSNKKMIKLLENDPNPFSEKTTIKFYIPEDVQKAQIYFYDNSGNILRIIDIKEKGEGTVEVFASNLSSGIYTYSLVANGKVVDTKRMVKTE